ncbi:MAG: fasciclin domain-containing protein [Microscillaceae bacterium]|nr:fasciclin domain-containing protein [Microscillaceae bacterium]
MAALLTELGVTNLSGFTTDEVATILTYHVLGAEVFSGDVPNDGVETVAGQDITTAVNMMSGAVTITDAEDRVTNVTSVDINMSNGVVHVIDRVLLPIFP